MYSDQFFLAFFSSTTDAYIFVCSLDSFEQVITSYWFPIKELNKIFHIFFLRFMILTFKKLLLNNIVEEHSSGN